MPAITMTISTFIFEKQLGCYEVTLNVWAGNTSAEKFYVLFMDWEAMHIHYSDKFSG